MAFLKADDIKYWNGIKINEYFLTEHNSNKIEMPTKKLPKEIRGITIHNVEWLAYIGQNTTQSEQYTRATINGNMGSIRAHFYVDEKEAWQNLPLTLSGWHSTDGEDGEGNASTISIECVMDGSENSYCLKAEDNAAKLAAYLLYKYDLNVDKNLFTHNHWLNIKDKKIGTTDELNRMKNQTKNCPIYILPHWAIFKAKVRTYLNKLKEVEPSIDIEDTIKQEIENTAAPVIIEQNMSKEEEKQEIEKIEFPVITYRVFSYGTWSPECISNEQGEADAVEMNRTINGFSMKINGLKVRYRSHFIGGRWLDWVSNYGFTDWSKGISGMKLRQIDAIQIELVDCDDYEIQYRVADKGTWLKWITGLQGEGTMSYAGIFNKPINKIQMRIIKK